MLKSITAICLSLFMLVSSLIPQNDVEELGKLPALFRHYRYHAQPAQGGLSLGQFLVQHYAAGAASGTDSWHLGSVAKIKRQPEEHDSLPLQGQHNVPPLVYLVPTVRLALTPSRLQWVTKARPRLAQLRYADAHGPALLQPPRA
ncbi:hypothetical protein GO988_00350 [Hymenobacter sp. HMF4947]|uniref:Uncharacterized protein n=1 Tax=Hymenobacter ginkgonis TaxID=2682976 RepID=A0A7K1T8N4_9BACT|nr:hypothetical protein [Hymenobacter ginkgonis]MVN74769.1 hypothetical protein [Hymenobacter ginkgonis]